MGLRELLEKAFVASRITEYSITVEENKWGKKVFLARFNYAGAKCKIILTKNLIVYPSFFKAPHGWIELDPEWNIQDSTPFVIKCSIEKAIKAIKDSL